jgi:hypothetical protein
VACSRGTNWPSILPCLLRPITRPHSWRLELRPPQKELTASPSKIREWFAELEHYGFIVLHQPGNLGVDGKGKARAWQHEQGKCRWTV